MCFANNLCNLQKNPFGFCIHKFNSQKYFWLSRSISSEIKRWPKCEVKIENSHLLSTAPGSAGNAWKFQIYVKYWYTHRKKLVNFAPNLCNDYASQNHDKDHGGLHFSERSGLWCWWKTKKIWIDDFNWPQLGIYTQFTHDVKYYFANAQCFWINAR